MRKLKAKIRYGLIASWVCLSQSAFADIIKPPSGSSNAGDLFSDVQNYGAWGAKLGFIALELVALFAVAGLLLRVKNDAYDKGKISHLFYWGTPIIVIYFIIAALVYLGYSHVSDLTSLSIPK